MKKTALCLAAMLCLLLTACAAPQEAQEPQLTYEQQLSHAVALCRNDLPGGIKQLSALGAQLLGGTQIRQENCVLGVWQLQCAQRPALLWRLDCEKAETAPATLDTLCLAWEGAAYYSSEGDGTYSTVQGRQGQAVLFNVEDDHLASGESACGVVYLQDPAEAWTVRLTHTFTAKETAWVVEQYDNDRFDVNTTASEVTRSVEIHAAARLQQEELS